MQWPDLCRYERNALVYPIFLIRRTGCLRFGCKRQQSKYLACFRLKPIARYKTLRFGRAEKPLPIESSIAGVGLVRTQSDCDQKRKHDTSVRRSCLRPMAPRGSVGITQQYRAAVQ